MINLRLDSQDHHAQLRATLRNYLQAAAPSEVINKLDAEGRYPEDIVEGMAELGVFGLTISPEYGGIGADAISVAIACEELQRAGLSLLSAVAPTITYCAPAIETFGTEHMRRELLPSVAKGLVRMAIGLTEPDTGSDLSSTSMSATPVSGGFLVSGTKVWCTGAARADYIVALARTAPGSSGFDGLSVLLLPTAKAEVSIRKIPKLAGQATASCEVFIDQLFVDQGSLIGPLDEGRRVVFASLDSERLYVAAQCVGVAQGAYDSALRYATERQQFGRPIIEHQAVGHKLADMAGRLLSARLLTYSIAAKITSGESYGVEAALAKVVASEAASAVVQDAMSVLGAYSYSTEYPLERYYREIKLLEIAGGTNQVLRNVISKRLPTTAF